MEDKKIGAVLVLGAGIGGIQASLDLAESGYKVYLMEEKSCIGGTMAQLDKTFPTNDCSMCIISPKLVETGRHLNIALLTYASLEEVSGGAGNFRVKIKKKARFVNLEKCTGCADCEKECPVEVESEFNEGLENRRAIYRLYPQAIPNAFTIDKKGISPCRVGCPVGVNVQGYVALISQGKFKEAIELIKEVLPFPGICGRACHHPCERECNRKEVDEAVAIRPLKRFVSDWAIRNIPEEIGKIEEEREEKIAIIGAGPAGLTAAFRLRQMGYQVTIFDLSEKAGGLVTSCLPEYRIPLEVANRDINWVLSHDIEIKQKEVGKDISLVDIRGEFKAVFVAIGYQESIPFEIESLYTGEILSGLDFLKEVKRGVKPQGFGEKIAVIGGGNVAIDVSRTALRLGAKEVTILYRRSREEMPANEWEIEEAIEEGIKINYLTIPKKTIHEKRRLVAVICQRMKLGEPDESGRRRPIPIEDSHFEIEVDTIISAIGQKANLEGFEDLEKDKKGGLKVNPQTLMTNLKGVFAGGDVVSGPASIIEAVAHGNKVAKSIHNYLNGVTLETEEKEKEIASLPQRKIEKKERVKTILKDPQTRKYTFIEVEKSLNEEEAILEAGRCLNCAICSECMQCVKACKPEAIDHNMEEEIEEIEVGAIILTPGFDEFDAKIKGEYGYGYYENVVTSIEFERILSASGPYQGHVKRLSDGQEPKRIAFIQCVGSRDTGCESSYCSSVCCMYATKEAVIAKEHVKGLESTIFFMDMRAYGKGFNEYYERAEKKYGVRYIRSMVSSVKELQSSKNLLLKYINEGEIIEEEFDLVVLSVGLRPKEKITQLASKLSIDLNKHNFSRSNVFTPIETTRDGIYVSGVFSGPKDIPETVSESSAAAACASILLSEKRGSLIKAKSYPMEKKVEKKSPRIGVFICNCGINIGGYIDVPAVVKYAQSLPFVVYCEDNLFTCSQDTQEKIKKAIEEHDLNRVVVASCSPRTHEGLFQETLRESGLNPYLFEMANIRDQCSWVHMREPKIATSKAKTLVRMAIAKVAIQESLKKVAVSVNKKALVVGGGVSGMVASLSLASQGYKVYLIERERELGGNLKHIYYTLEGGDPQEYLSRLLEKVENSDIEVFKNTQVVNFSGHVGNFKTKIKSLNGRDRELELEHGVVIVATGGVEYKPTEYGYGENENIVTQKELEKMIRNKDIYSGIKEVVMIQCVGSREEDRPYCSRICCTQAVKNALKLKEMNKDRNIYILAQDVRTYGFKEDFYQSARELGIIFIKYNKNLKPQVKRGDNLSVKVYDLALREEIELAADLIVLSSAILSHPENVNLAPLLKIPLNADNFFLEAHPKLRPVDFAGEGIFLCGLAHSPKLIDECISQSLAASSRATTILSKEELWAGGVVAVIDGDKCAACLTCLRVCAYGVPFINKEGVAEVEAVKCQGCGTCAGECPAKAIQLQNYGDEQILAKCQALFIQVYNENWLES